MRQRIITALAALVYFAVGYAGNISVDAITLKPGEAKDLKISLSSSVGHKVGVQFDVTLPDGFSLVNYSDSKVYHISSNQVSDMTCEVSDLGNNSYKFILYSSTLQELKAGELMSLNLKVTSGKALGNYNISVSNVAFSDVDGNVTKESGVSATVKVTDFFKLIYKVDGVEYKSFDVEYGSSITPESAPTKEGYTFSGWSMIPATMPAQDVTVTGSFTINKYKLTYKVDGEVYKSYDVEYGAAITPESAPTKEGYTFSGWSMIPATMPAQDVTVTGSFTKGAYKLTYMVDGEVYKTLSYDYGSTITSEPAPTKEGYTFSGWSEIPATMPAKDVTVTGTFAINQYTITYKIDDEVYQTENVDYGSTITPPNAPEREGYTFEWIDVPETMPAHDITIIGSYTSGINAIRMDAENGKVFDLNGRQVKTPGKGVYIINGRKVVIK